MSAIYFDTIPVFEFASFERDWLCSTVEASIFHIRIHLLYDFTPSQWHVFIGNICSLLACNQNKLISLEAYYRRP